MRFNFTLLWFKSMGSNVQLSSAHLKEVLSILNCFVPEVDVWVYGSRANGTAHSAEVTA